MRSLRFALAAAAMIATTAMASPADPKNGAEFTTLATPQPTQQVGKQVEVLEFFAYHCPACNFMEPHVAAWVKKQGSNVNFKRIPLAFQGAADPEAHLYLTLEAMNKVEEVSPKVFRAFHVERQRLTKEDAILEWVGKSSGLNKAQFMEAWNSFGVLTKLKRLGQIAASYRVDGTPTFVVDGRFVTSPTTIRAANPGIDNQLGEATMATLDALVAKAMKDKGVTAAAATAAAAPAKTVKK